MVQGALHQATPIVPLTKSAFSAKVALACEVARLICEPGPVRVSLFRGRVSELAWDAGRKSAMEGDHLGSPLIDLAVARCAGVGRLFELAYWSHATSIDPSSYFDLAGEGQWVCIKSKGVAGAAGEVRLHISHIREFFACAKALNPTAYESWALDPHPVGGTPVLYRYYRIARGDDSEDVDGDASVVAVRETDPQEGKLVINPDAHPSRGRLCFGDPGQELLQIGALIQLESHAHRLIAQSTPTPTDRLAAAARAAVILRRVRTCFMSSTGYCTWCRSDVTTALANRGQDDAITACPHCWHTWCD
jgi:hypothetical protein